MRTIYTPLDAVKNEIRVLLIEPGDFIDPVSCHTTVVCLDDDPQYTALSYSWGDRPETSTITFNGVQQYEVRSNLHSALQHIRSGSEIVALWTDALCINQIDNEEKSYMIKKMKAIYLQAHSTCIWLGPEEDNSNLAMDTIQSLHEGADYELKNFTFTADQLRSLQALQSRPWWYRTWVIQEAILSPRPYFRCGNKILPFAAFVFLDDVRRGYHRPTKTWIDQMTRAERFVIPANPFSAILTDYPDDRPRVLAGNAPLFEWTGLAVSFHATDPRDKIYGLLGLATPSDIQFIQPDYNATVADVYAHATARFIITTQELVWLQFDRDNVDPELGLPSWVPDYSSDPARPKRLYIQFQPSAYHASGRSAWGSSKILIRGQFRDSWSIMFAKGLLVDKVVYVGRNPYVEPYRGHDVTERLENNAKRAMQTRQNVLLWEEEMLLRPQTVSPYKPKEPPKDAFWRTLMAGRTFDWESVQDVHRTCFDIWLDREKMPDSAVDQQSTASLQEQKRVFVKPFTDACVSRCHGRSFILTEKGYMGLAPFKTEIGDVVVVLQGSYVPSVLRRKKDNDKDGPSWELVGETYVHGIMEGETVTRATEQDVQEFKLV